jgi:hypothetical protein
LDTRQWLPFFIRATQRRASLLWMGTAFGLVVSPHAHESTAEGAPRIEIVFFAYQTLTGAIFLIDFWIK